MGEVFAGRYELVDPLASGGGGVIWRVWDLRVQEYRAGKVLKQSHSDSLIRFMRETSWRVEHEHVITPLGWAGEDDKVMFTMPLIRGGSLAQIIKEQGALPPAFAVKIIEQLLESLVAVHETGLVHRDVKPANILMEPSASPGKPDPFTYLSDFGIAAPIGDPRMTRATEVIGTPGYMSPEAQYGADPTPQQDLYSVGVVLLEMLTGRRPPADGTPEIPAAAANVPLGRFIAKLFDEETKRYQTARSALDALHATTLPRTGNRPIVVPDRIPDFPEGWNEAGPMSAQAGSQARPGAIPAGGSVTSLPGQQFPMEQAPSGAQQHRPAPGWAPTDTPGQYQNSPVSGRRTPQPPPNQPQQVPQGMASPSSRPMPSQPIPAQPLVGQGYRPAAQQVAPQGGYGQVAQHQQGSRTFLQKYAALPESVGWGLLALGAIVAGLALFLLLI
ncbi:serine/threonine protein kinase [Aestuariimicrobium sp. Y1814]|uniref:serine/threonine protein kinase n=1 Tax=Aestuariimicrobium sp. Y1814 TaxID=3418742 RepID=UPI003DA77996